MRFDFIIGNPPYNEDFSNSGENGNFAAPIYNKFLDESYKISDKVELIHPARFLFNAGSTPKDWNYKMLHDPHFRILFYEQDSKSVFANTDIKGGVCVSYRDSTREFGELGVFVPEEELKTISEKVDKISKSSIADIIFNQNKYDLDVLYSDNPDLRKIIGSNGRDKRFRNNAFEKIKVFKDKPDSDSIRVLGLIKNKRVWKYINSKYVDKNHENLSSFKVVVPAANGSGGRGVLGTPTVLKPNEAFTQTFISFGSFDNEYEAENTVKYLKTKFSRLMLSLLKITQHNEKPTWLKVPNQNFSQSSDIDWSKPVSEIDQQLYKKYGLDQKEIEFIESHVKEME